MHTQEVLANGLGSVAYKPNPEDPDGPWGPWGPVIRDMIIREAIYGSIAQRFNRLVIAGLNPQPLPPVDGPSLAALRAQALINQGMVYATDAERTGSQHDQAQKEAWQGNLSTILEDWCGTGRRPWPFPWPPPWEWERVLHGEELIAAGVQFKIAAGFDTSLQNDFAAAADQLISTGMGQLG